MKQLNSTTDIGDVLGLSLKTLIEKTAQEQLLAHAENIKQAKEDMDKVLAETQEAIKTGLTIKIKTGAKVNKLSGLKHKSLEKLITLVSQNLSVLLVGMAGTGKTHAGEQTATALGIPFYALSVGAQTSKSDIVGFISANGTYIPTLFRKAYEQGGVFLMDEIDAGNSNVLIQINAALSNNYCAFPDGMIKRHKDFRFIATANTYGFGASRMYVGRNQLDAATLDRFAVLNWDIDENLEELLVPNDLGKSWIKVVRAIRKHVIDSGIRSLVTPRATMRGHALLSVDLEFNDVLQISILNGIPSDQHEKIRNVAKNNWHPPTKVNPPKLIPKTNSQRNVELVEAMETTIEPRIQVVNVIDGIPIPF